MSAAQGNKIDRPGDLSGSSQAAASFSDEPALEFPAEWGPAPAPGAAGGRRWERTRRNVYDGSRYVERAGAGGRSSSSSSLFGQQQQQQQRRYQQLPPHRHQQQGLELDQGGGHRQGGAGSALYAGQQQQWHEQELEVGDVGGEQVARIYPEHSSALKRNKPVKWSAEEDRKLREAVERVRSPFTIAHNRVFSVFFPPFLNIHLYLPAPALATVFTQRPSGQAVVTGVLPFLLPRIILAFIFFCKIILFTSTVSSINVRSIAHKVQHSHFSKCFYAR